MVWKSLYLFLKKPIIIVIFREGEVRRSRLPTSLLIHNSEIRKISRNDGYQIYGNKQIRAAS